MLVDPRNPINLEHPFARGLNIWYKTVPGFQRGGKIVRDLCRHNGPADLVWDTGGIYDESVQEKYIGSDRPGGHGAWDLDGTDDFLKAPFSPKFSLLKFTIMMWVYSRDSTAYLIHHGTSKYFELSWNSGALRLRKQGGTVVATGGSVATNTWQHVAATHDGTTARIYIDAVEVDSGAVAMTTNASQDLWIGTNSDVNRWFDGKIDDVRIYNYCMPPEVLTKAYLESFDPATSLLNRHRPEAAISVPAVADAPSVGGSATAARGSVVNPSQPVNWGHPLNRGLVSCWKQLQGSDGLVTRDLAGQNPLTWQTAGRTIGSSRGQVLDFTQASSQYATVADSPSLDFTATLTMSAWCKVPTAAGYKHIFVKPATSSWTAPYARYMMRIDAAGGVLGWIESDGGWALTGAVPAGEWFLATTTFDGTNIRIYINGIQEASSTKVTSITASDQPLYIGAENSPGNYYDGQLDDIRLYNRALSSADAMQLYLESRVKHSRLLNYIEPAEFNAAAITGGPWPHHIDNYDLSGNFSGLGV